MPETGDHKDPFDLHNKPAVLEAQRAADAAWEAVSTYRKQVDTARRADAAGPEESGGVPPLRPWTEQEDQEFAALHAAAAAAGEARARALAGAGLTSTYEVEVEVRRHAREATDTAGTSSAGHQPR